ncbi:MAG: MliC family protein [Sphingomonadaceae bacterium]|nr:MliC family protein [Sphingomonadaceae bacterium]
MRAFQFAGMAFFLLAGCAGHVREAAEPVIAYACADGKTARVLYEGGGYFPRATARLDYDEHEYHLSATPPTYGLRYVSEGGENAPVTIWSVRGEDAWIGRLDPGQSEEREIAHCTRVRG